MNEVRGELESLNGVRVCRFNLVEEFDSDREWMSVHESSVFLEYISLLDWL